MMKYMVVRDRRLHGGVPARHGIALQNVDAGTPLRVVFNHVTQFAASGKIHCLFLLCHGYAGANLRLRVSMDSGGMGLQLGKEDVKHANVNAWMAIKDKIDNIVSYACAAADTQPGAEHTTADGQYLMGALAICTNANVYAANRIPWYHMHKGMPHGAYDFGKWEGTLYRFSKSTGLGTEVRSAPVELTAVFDGTAP